jgi:hypothetical protein
VLIESKEIQEHINEIIKKTCHLNFGDNILVTAVLKDVKKCIDDLEVKEAGKNAQHKHAEALRGLQNR